MVPVIFSTIFFLKEQRRIHLLLITRWPPIWNSLEPKQVQHRTCFYNTQRTWVCFFLNENPHLKLLAGGPRPSIHSSGTLTQSSQFVIIGPSDSFPFCPKLIEALADPTYHKLSTGWTLEWDPGDKDTWLCLESLFHSYLTGCYLCLLYVKYE